MVSVARQRLSIAAVAAAAALGAGALYASASSGPDGRADRAALAAEGPAAFGTYSALESSDQQPPGRVREMIDVLNRGHDINPYATRGVKTEDGTQAWIIPARDAMCFGVADPDGAGYSCVTPAELREGRLAMSAADTGGAVRAVYLVADGVVALEAGGTRFSAVNNTVTANYRRGATVVRIDEDGTRSEVPGS